MIQTRPTFANHARLQCQSSRTGFATALLPLSVLAGCLDLGGAELDDHAADNAAASALTTTTTLQAEAATFSGAIKATNQRGYTGTGFVDYQHASGDYIEWTVRIAEAGAFDLGIRYANASGTRSLALAHKRSTATSFSPIGTMSFPATSSWSSWSTRAMRFNFSNAGTYKVRLTATGTGGPNVDSLVVTGPIGSSTTAPPSITSHPAAAAAAVGESATFSVAASGAAPLAYQWQRNGANISGATAASYTRSNLQTIDDQSTYRCLVSNAYGAATSNSATLAVSAPTASRNANLTWFESYPDPDSEECVEYNGCQWEGQFAALPDKMPESWVRANNIIAVHERDFSQYRLKTLRIKQGSRQIDAKVYDMCADSDCDGCCTRNANRNGAGFLIDMEKYTVERFGADSGTVTWTCLDCN